MFPMSIKGTRHCGKVAFQIDAEIPATLTRCARSFCAKHGRLYACFEPAQFRLTMPETGHGNLPLAIKNGGA